MWLSSTVKHYCHKSQLLLRTSAAHLGSLMSHSAYRMLPIKSWKKCPETSEVTQRSNLKAGAPKPPLWACVEMYGPPQGKINERKGHLLKPVINPTGQCQTVRLPSSLSPLITLVCVWPGEVPAAAGETW